MHPSRWSRVVGAIVAPFMIIGCSATPPPPPPPAASPTTWEDAPTDDASLYRIVLDQLPPSLALDASERPDAQLVRWVKPDLWAQAQAEGMTDNGYPSTVSQGSIRYPEVPPAQNKAFTLVRYVCVVSFPVDPRTRLSWTREQAERQYRHLVDTVKPCVRRLGIPVDEPPTFEVWFAGYRAESSQWHPYQGVPMFDVELLDRAYEQCPATASDLYPDDIKG